MAVEHTVFVYRCDSCGEWDTRYLKDKGENCRHCGDTKLVLYASVDPAFVILRTLRAGKYYFLDMPL